MLANFLKSFPPRLLLTLHRPFKKQCVRYPSGSAHVAAGLSESADPGRGVWVGIGETVEDLGVV